MLETTGCAAVVGIENESYFHKWQLVEHMGHLVNNSHAKFPCKKVRMIKRAKA